MRVKAQRKAADNPAKLAAGKDNRAKVVRAAKRDREAADNRVSKAKTVNPEIHLCEAAPQARLLQY